MSVRVVLHNAAFDALRKSPEIMADLERRARQIAAQAGDGFEVEVDRGPRRGVARVVARSSEAKRAEATDAALTRAIDAGRR